MLQPIAARWCRGTVFLFAVAMLLLSVVSDAWAGAFEFRETASDAVLARLQTDGTDPFDHRNIAGLSFTTAGDALFGFGVGVYSGTFEDTFASNRWTFDGNDLTAVDPLVSGIFTDNAPPASTVLDATTPIFSLRLEPRLTGQMVFVDGTLPNFIAVQGTWHAVPEPTSTMLLLIIGLCLIQGRRQSRP